MKKVSDVTKIDVVLIQQPSRTPHAKKREITNARQMSMKLSKEFTPHSLGAIGKEHGGRDHATVLHACKTIDNLIDTKNPEIYQTYMKLEHIISTWKIERDNMLQFGKPNLQEETIFNTEK
jgi:chromosomal replication initiation ATPase DnaA